MFKDIYYLNDRIFFVFNTALPIPSAIQTLDPDMAGATRVATRDEMSDLYMALRRRS